jgi:hypothetical protein
MQRNARIMHNCFSAINALLRKNTLMENLKCALMMSSIKEYNNGKIPK